MDSQLSNEKRASTSDVPERHNTEPLEEPRIENAQHSFEEGVVELSEEKQVPKPDDIAEDGTAELEPVFSIFSRGEKTLLVIMASLAALFSPLSANIYLPALNVLAKDLYVSNTLINLTVTSYLVGLDPH